MRASHHPMAPGLDPAMVRIGGGVDWRAAVAGRGLVEEQLDPAG
jgi:hypothetical protein